MKKLAIALTAGFILSVSVPAVNTYAVSTDFVEEIVVEEMMDENLAEDVVSEAEAIVEEKKTTMETTTVLESEEETEGRSVQEISAESDGGEVVESPEADFEWSGTTITAYIGTDAVVVIPAKAEKIGQNAFSRNETLEEVVIGENVTVVDEKAFFFCKNLRSVTFAGNKVLKIGANAFDTTAISTIELPDSLQSIESHAFSSCVNLQEITIPKEVTKIGYRAFYNTSNLKKVTFETIKLGRTEGCGNEIFGGSSINQVTFAQGTSYIPDNMFYRAGFESGAAIEIPEGVTEIGLEAFYYARNLSKVTFAGNKVVKIGDNAFDCTAISEIELPDSLQSIGSHAFSGCVNLQEITIPKEVTKIGYRAFYNTSNLKKVTFETIKLGRTDGCGNEIFGGSSINQVTFAQGTTYIPDNMFYRAGFESGAAIEIPEGVTEIGLEAFYYARNLSKVTFAGDKVVTIGNNAFDSIAISTINLPDSLQSIGSHAFSGCVNLQEITIPKEVTKIGYRAFYNTSNLKKVTFETTKLGRTDGCGNEIFEGSSINQVTFAQGTTYIPDNMLDRAGFESGAAIEIPEGVTEIGLEAFYYARNLSKVTFAGDKVVTIGNNAFDSIAISTINLPDSLQNIGSHAFSGCVNLQEITIPKEVTKIGYRAFYNTSNLKKVTFETTKLGRTDGCGNEIFGGSSINQVTFAQGTTYIPDNMFDRAGFESGAAIEIPEGVTEIGLEAFYYANNLGKVSFAGNKVVTIGNNAFDSIAISTINLPDSLQSIGSHAFSNCDNLQIVSIPGKVKTIGYRAFYYCDNLARVILPAKVKTISNEAIAKNSFLKVYAPKGSASYKWAVKNGYNVGEIFTIKYNLQGGVNGEGNPTSYEKGDRLTFTEPTKKGFKFAGWYKDGKFKKPFTYTETTKGNLTLYAKWEAISYTITYETNGGTLAKKSPVSYTSASAVKLKNPTKTGYTFTGWYTTMELTPESIIKKIEKGNAGEITLYAGWQANSYKIKFSKNGKNATGTMDMITQVVYDTEVILPQNVFERKGYVFAGWNTKANGKGVSITDEAAVTNLTAQNNQTVTLHAVWEVIPYTITYHLEDGNNHAKNPVTYTVTQKVAFKKPTRTGYIFKGWYTDPEFTQKITQIKPGTTGDIEVYAKWQVK